MLVISKWGDIINGNEKNVFEQFPAILDKYIEKKIYEVIGSLGIECSDYGTIVETIEDDNGNVIYATVCLADNQIIEGMVNHSGYHLDVGDKVKIYGSRTNVANRYIGVKCQEEII